MTCLIASIVSEAVVFISALYYAYTLHSVGWCPRILLAGFALSTMYDLILSSLQLVFEVRQCKLERLLVKIQNANKNLWIEELTLLHANLDSLYVTDDDDNKPSERN